MTKETFLDGFTGAFTWENVGTQVANGIISGGASFAIGMLLNSLTKQDQKMDEMFQKFADQIVQRLSVKMKEIVNTAFYQENMQELLEASRALEDEYRAYLIVFEKNLLYDLEEKSFEVNQKSMSMGIPAIGVYCVQKTIQIAVFLEKAKFNDSYVKLINVEIDKAKQYLQSLHKLGIEQVDAAFRIEDKSQYGDDGELDISWVNIYYEDVEIKRVVTATRVREDYENYSQIYGFLKAEKYTQFEKEVYNPALLIINKLEEGLNNFSPE